MDFSNELCNYFDSKDIDRVYEYIKNEKLDFSFWQIIQKDNNLKFELGFLQGHFLIDVTLQDHALCKTVLDLSKIIWHSITEKDDSLKINVFVNGNANGIYYETSSSIKKELLKKFGNAIDKTIRGLYAI